MKTVSIQNIYNAGKLSPLMFGRFDLPKYRYGCKELQNMLVLPHGPVKRRPGTYFIKEVKNSSKQVKLLSFIFSDSDAYILEFGEEHIRFYRNRGQIVNSYSAWQTATAYVIGDLVSNGGSYYRCLIAHTSGTFSVDLAAGKWEETDGATDLAYEIPTEFTESELFNIHKEQSADIMYLTNENHLIQELTRSGHTSWDLSDSTVEDGPFLTENETDITITPSDITGNITLTASDDLFTEDQIGALFKLTQMRETTYVSGTFAGVGTSSTIEVAKDTTIHFDTHGAWTGLIALEASYDEGATWEAVKSARAVSGDNNVDQDVEELLDDAQYRVNMLEYDNGSCTYNLSLLNYQWEGIVRITGVNSETEAEATVLTELASTVATKRWSEGAWSEKEGYPSTLSFFQERIFFASKSHRLPRIWGSKSFRYAPEIKMRIGSDMDDARDDPVTIAGQDPIMWLTQMDKLIIATSQGEYSYDLDLSGDTATPKMKRIESIGSSNLQPIPLGNIILYIEKGNRKIRALAYNEEYYRYASEDFTIMSEDITESGIVDIAFQKRPWPILWCVLENGKIVSMTYVPEHGVFACAEHVLEGGEAESVAVIPSDDEDEVWLVVKRTINNTTKRYIEMMMPQDFGDLEDAYFVDCGLSFDGGDAVNISNISIADADGKITITVSSWPVDGDGNNIADGDQVKLTGISGTTELNYKVFTVSDADVSGKTFILKDSGNSFYWDGSGYEDYTSGGSVQKVEKNFANLGHLEGETVSIFADGRPWPEDEVESGEIDLEAWANKVHIGKSMEWVLETMNIENPSAGTIGKNKKITSLVLGFHETARCSYGPDENNLKVIEFISAETDELELFTGIKILDFPAMREEQLSVYLTGDDPLPATVTFMSTEIEIGE